MNRSINLLGRSTKKTKKLEPHARGEVPGDGPGVQDVRFLVSKQSLSPSLMPQGERTVEEERNRAEERMGNRKKRGGVRGQRREEQGGEAGRPSL